MTQSPTRLQRSIYKITKVFFVLLILAVGLFFRIEDYGDWRRIPERAFFQGRPLLTTFDGYYYLRFAQELRDGTYDTVDTLRAFPQKPHRPMPPPLLSLLTAFISRLTGISVEWTAAFLPPLIGILLFFPLFFIGRLWGNTLAGFTAGLIGLVSPYYVDRSAIGRFDTDCANITFLMNAVLLAALLSRTTGRRKALVLGGALLNLVLYLLWWDTTPHVVVGLSLGPLALGYLFVARPGKRELQAIAILLVVAAGGIVLWKGWDFLIRFPGEILQLHRYISKLEVGDFPNIGVTISEQARLMGIETVRASTGGIFLFFLAVIGLLILIIQSPARLAFLLTPLVLGGLALLYAKRFAIFLSPLVALGAGHFYGFLWEHFRPHSWKSWRLVVFLLGCAAVPLLLVQIILPNLAKPRWLVEPPGIVEGMTVAREATPPGSVIWAWWDHGYPLMYYSGRGTISDGSFHAAELSLVNAFPLCTPDYGQAARWMRFYVTRGPKGFERLYQAMGSVAEGLVVLQELMAAGPKEAPALLEKKGLHPSQEWLDFLFPAREEAPPLYLFLDQRLSETSHWWFWLGSWSPERREGVHPIFRPFALVERDGDLIKGFPHLLVDMKQGLLTLEGKSLPLSSVIYAENGEWKSRNYGRDGLVFEYDPAKRWGVLCSPEIFDSLFNRLFFLRTADINRFKPVFLKTGTVQIWEVTGE